MTDCSVLGGTAYGKVKTRAITVYPAVCQSLVVKLRTNIPVEVYPQLLNCVHI